MIKLYLAAAITLTGCAGAPPSPPQQLTPEQIVIRDKARQDMAVCRFEAAKSTQRSQTGYTLSHAISDEMNDSMQRAQLYELCLQAKGYGANN